MPRVDEVTGLDLPDGLWVQTSLATIPDTDLRKSVRTPIPTKHLDRLWAGSKYLRAVILEAISVGRNAPDEPPNEFSRRGLCRAFVARLRALPGYDLFVVEAVGNVTLRAALTRWGWVGDTRVQDYYWPVSPAAVAAVERVKAEEAARVLKKSRGIPPAARPG